MAIPASALSLSSSRMKMLKGHLCQFHSHALIHARNLPTSATCSVKPPIIVQSCDPPMVKLHMNYVKAKLWDVIPDSVKELPWKKTEATALRQLLGFGREALKWSLVAVFIFSSVSDVIYSLSRDKELLIPFGLFVGCLVTNFLKETFQELFPNSEPRGLGRHLFSMGCFFVLVKILSAYFTGGRRVFLLHAANGGLIQILWLWKSSPEKQDAYNIDGPLPEDALTAVNAEY